MAASVEDQVRTTVNALVGVPSPEAFDHMAALAGFSAQDLLPELFLQVEEAAAGLDLNTLKPTLLLPDVTVTKTIVEGVRAETISPLRAAVSGGYADLVTTLLATAAACKEA